MNIWNGSFDPDIPSTEPRVQRDVVPVAFDTVCADRDVFNDHNYSLLCASEAHECGEQRQVAQRTPHVRSVLLELDNPFASPAYGQTNLVKAIAQRIRRLGGALR